MTVSALSLEKLLGKGKFFRCVGGLARRQAHGRLSQTWVQVLALALASCVISDEPPKAAAILMPTSWEGSKRETRLGNRLASQRARKQRL